MFEKLRCINVGENKKTEELYIGQGYLNSFEYTAVGIHQQNRKIERKLLTVGFINFDGFSIKFT